MDTFLFATSQHLRCPMVADRGLEVGVAGEGAVLDGLSCGLFDSALSAVMRHLKR